MIVGLAEVVPEPGSALLLAGGWALCCCGAGGGLKETDHSEQALWFSKTRFMNFRPQDHLVFRSSTQPQTS
jgi:hypothetical protein